MRNHLRAGLVFFLLIPAAIALAGHGHGGSSHGGSHGTHSHGGGSHGGHGHGFGWHNHGGHHCGPSFHHWHHSGWWWPSFSAGYPPYGDGPYDDPEYDQDDGLARLFLNVQPGDAVVYLDDELLGTAEEVSGAGSGIPLPAGGHTLEVARPGFQTQGLDFEVDDGEGKSVEVDLEK
jgi:hypothetical protein